MDNSSVIGGNKPAQEQKQTAIEYTAQAASPLVGGEVKLTINENSLAVSAVFDAAEIPFAQMTALTFTDYVVTIKTTEGDYVFSRMGQWGQPFYDALCDAYNKAVLRSLFVSGKPIITVKGAYSFVEGGTTGGDNAPIQVYENAVVALPPNLLAKRIPLCFVRSMEKDNYILTLKLDTDESYTFSKLGYDTAPVETAIEKQIRALREKALAAVKEIDPSLSAAHASQVAKIMPNGVAVPIGQLAAIAPTFVAALEATLSDTRAADSYKAFKELCDPARIYVGVRKNEATDTMPGGSSKTSGIGGVLGGLVGGGNPLAALGGPTGAEPAAANEGESEPPAPYLIWLIAPSPDGQFAAVEFAEADSATFVYRTGGDFNEFAKQLNRALEAISFKREIIRMADEEIRKPENVDYLMASQRTAALKFVRGNFAGRVIHSSTDAWKRNLEAIYTSRPPT